MKNQIIITLSTIIFLVFTSISYAAFPVKKVVKQNAIENSTINQSDNQESAYVVNTTSAASGKSQIVALLLCWVVGIIGIHRFYLGYTWQGIVQIFTLGGLGIWTLIDFVRIIMGTLEPKDGAYSKTF